MLRGEDTPEEMKELERLKLECLLSYGKEETSVYLSISCVLPSSGVTSTPSPYSIISLVSSWIEHMCNGHASFSHIACIRYVIHLWGSCVLDFRSPKKMR